MHRRVEGSLIVIGAVVGVTVVLAMAVAWGPQSKCAAQFPKIIGCALASYEALSGGLIAAAGALFAGWLAWSAARDQIAMERTKARTQRFHSAQEKHAAA